MSKDIATYASASTFKVIGIASYPFMMHRRVHRGLNNGLNDGFAVSPQTLGEHEIFGKGDNLRASRPLHALRNFALV